MLDESIFMERFAGIFLLCRLENCAVAGKTSNTNKQDDINLTALK